MAVLRQVIKSVYHNFASVNILINQRFWLVSDCIRLLSYAGIHILPT
ncbi:hypothetical protein AO385_1072 [Moraxella catarrhalis]|nr:hypothetical protein AO385_1072 [Moraxella catarrhalis]